MLDSTRDFFATLSQILLRRWLMGLGLLVVWFAALPATRCIACTGR